MILLYRLIPRLDQNLHLYGVEGQIKNKKEFINQYVPKGCKIHLLGHSVGAYMSLQLLKDDSVSFFFFYNYLPYH